MNEAEVLGRELLALLKGHLGHLANPVRLTLGGAGSLGDRYELWVHGEERSCHLERMKEGNRCTFRQLNTHMAVGETTDTAALAAAIARWMEGRARVDELGHEFPFVRVEPHARAYEEGRLAEWQWDDTLERARSLLPEKRDDVLVYHLPLLERLAQQPVIRRFFTFTSHESLCFSRCPDYPFSTWGLPRVTPLLERGHKPGTPASRYRVTCGKQRLEGDAASTLRFIEEVFQAEGDTSFDGSLEDAMWQAVNQMLVASGSALRCTRTSSGEWARMVVSHRGRACQLSAYESSSDEHPFTYQVQFQVSQPQPKRVAEGEFDDLDTLGRALRMWLEELAPLPLLRAHFRLTLPERTP